MRHRHWYVLLFALPALIVAAVAAGLLLAAVSGLLWLFVLGDDPWPSWTGTTLTTLFAVALLAVWIGLLYVAHAFGRRQEIHATLDVRHVWVAIGATVLLVAVLLAHQFSIGNLGPASAGVSCAEYCQAKGFLGSSMPPRNSGPATCSCIDADGREVLTTPMQDVIATD